VVISKALELANKCAAASETLGVSSLSDRLLSVYLSSNQIVRGETELLCLTVRQTHGKKNE